MPTSSSDSEGTGERTPRRRTSTRTTNSARTVLTVRTLLSVRLERDPIEALTPADNEEEVISRLFEHIRF